MIEKETVATYTLFQDLSPEELNRILELAREESYPRNAMLIEESSVNADLFVLLSGRVSVEIEINTWEGKKREQLVVLRHGEVFGEIAFLENKRSSAYVIALDNVRILRIDGVRLSKLMEEDAALGFHLMRKFALVLAKRLIDSNFRWRMEKG